MRAALDAAAAAASLGEVPVGAVVVLDGRVIATAANAPRTRHDPTAHAEMLAIRVAAEAIGDDRLSDCDLWVTLEPCAMCAGAIAHARIARLYYGASDPKGGAVENGPRLFAQPTVHHRPEIYPGIGEEEAARLLRDFFAMRRESGK
jgi:tRNA(Arg) A34 adenosine deaminase TadA